MPATAAFYSDSHPPMAQLRRVTFCLLQLTTALVVACHPARQADDAAPSPDRGPATVEVENRGFSDMTVYILDGARRERLGLASGHSTTSFTIPVRLVRGGSTLKFICDPIGDRALPVTEEILVQPGDVVSLIIMEH
jgi:hypothetical protein